MLGEMFSETVPEPVPDVPEEIAAQVRSDEALQLQFAPVVTVRVSGPPAMGCTDVRTTTTALETLFAIGRLGGQRPTSGRTSEGYRSYSRPLGPTGSRRYYTRYYTRRLGRLATPSRTGLRAH